MWGESRDVRVSLREAGGFIVGYGAASRCRWRLKLQRLRCTAGRVPARRGSGAGERGWLEKEWASTSADGGKTGREWMTRPLALDPFLQRSLIHRHAPSEAEAATHRANRPPRLPHHDTLKRLFMRKGSRPLLGCRACQASNKGPFGHHAIMPGRLVAHAAPGRHTVRTGPGISHVHPLEDEVASSEDVRCSKGGSRILCSALQRHSHHAAVCPPTPPEMQLRRKSSASSALRRGPPMKRGHGNVCSHSPRRTREAVLTRP